MPSYFTRSVFDLLAARNARRDNRNFCLCRFYSSEQSTLPDLHRQPIMFGLKTKRPGHATAAGIDFFNFEAPELLQAAHQWARADVGFLVAMAM